ncbi:IS element protein [Burkholderia dolosa AU0158]|nr:IS element protein [Burkholderia dolosa AU0158]
MSTGWCSAQRLLRMEVTPTQIQSRRDVMAAVHGIHEETRRSYGSRRMSQALRLLGHNVDRYRARSSMRQARLARSRRVHRYRVAQAESAIAPNLPARRFDPARRNQLGHGCATSRLCRPGGDGSTWPSSWICMGAALCG